MQTLNPELGALEVAKRQRRALTLIATSADAPDGSLTWHELTYDVLADPRHTVTRPTRHWDPLIGPGT